MRTIATAPPRVRPRATRIARLHAAMAEAMHDLLAELADFDDSGGWLDDGATDMVSWLTYQLGLLPRTARAWMDVARRLEELPGVRDRLSTGELSLDQARALCRVATPDDEDELADLATDMTAAELERMVRKVREIPRKQHVDDEVQRSVRWWWDQDERFMHLTGKLPAAEGAVVEKALLREAAKERPAPYGGGFRPLPERAADALAQIASEAIGRDGDPDRATIVVHVSAEHLATGQGTAVIEDGPVVAVETARRLACDSRWLVVVDGPDGTPIGVGRKTRRVPAWLDRLLRERDEGCRFPGCGRTRWTHAHHIEHWASTGRTDLDNLITLCGYHHRMIHNEGWAIRGDPNGQVEWILPHGSKLEPVRLLIDPVLPLEDRLRLVDEKYERRREKLKGRR